LPAGPTLAERNADVGTPAMTTAIILIVSGALIGAGITIILRDVRKSRRRAFVSTRDARAGSEPDIEITISHPDDVSQETVARPADANAEQPAAPGDAAATTASQPPRRELQPPTPAGSPSLEQQWSEHEAAIAGSVDRVNALLAPARLSIGASGEPTWSYRNKGYGGYRRILLGRDSVGWLRLELSADGRLHASVKAHKEDRAAINAAADTSSERLDAARIGDLLLQCLQPAVDHVAPQEPSSDRVASEQAWMSVDALVASALNASNGALSQAGARLVPVAPAAWEAALRRHRMTLRVEVNGNDIARMHIERLPHEMEVAVGVPDAQLADLGRRRRVPVEGMTIHALAELIAGCAWPAIARFREARRPA